MRIKAGLDIDNFWLNHSDKETLRKLNITLRHVSRCMNAGANDLAKQGKNRRVLIQGWFI